MSGLKGLNKISLIDDVVGKSSNWEYDWGISVNIRLLNETSIVKRINR